MKVKLRDLSRKQYFKWKDKKCKTGLKNCSNCIFKDVYCYDCLSSWVDHKDLYSDKFLDQELEIDVPILDKQEKEYLENLLKPFKDRVLCIEKDNSTNFKNVDYIFITTKGIENICCKQNFALPYFHKGTMYKGMEYGKEYSIKELGLFENERND